MKFKEKITLLSSKKLNRPNKILMMCEVYDDGAVYPAIIDTSCLMRNNISLSQSNYRLFEVEGHETPKGKIIIDNIKSSCKNC